MDTDIKNYLDKLDKKLDDEKLYMFCILVDRVYFTPIEEFYKINKYKIIYYSNERVATIKIYVKKKISCIKKKDSLVHLVFDIGEISNSGSLVSTGESLKVLYYEDDLVIKKPTLNDVQRFAKLCADGILGSSVIDGIKYSKLMDKLKEKKIKF